MAVVITNPKTNPANVREPHPFLTQGFTIYGTVTTSITSSWTFSYYSLRTLASHSVLAGTTLKTTANVGLLSQDAIVYWAVFAYDDSGGGTPVQSDFTTWITDAPQNSRWHATSARTGFKCFLLASNFLRGCSTQYAPSSSDVNYAYIDTNSELKYILAVTGITATSVDLNYDVKILDETTVI